jgi:hypothetical protein
MAELDIPEGQAFKLRPGDKILITMPATVDEKELAEMGARLVELSKRWLVEFAIVGAGAQATVIRADDG